MSKNILHDEIDRLIAKIRQGHDAFKRGEGKISRIDLDILLSDLRTLYEFCHELGDEKVQEAVQMKTEYQKPEIKTQSLQEETVTPEQVYMPEKEIIVKQEPLPEPAPAHQKHKGTVSTSLFDDIPSVADKYEEKTSVNDRLSGKNEDKSIAAKLKKKPIKDLKAAIGINEKFIFLNELFEGDSNEYNEAIDFINGLSSFAMADEYLKNGFAAKYNWNLRNKYVRIDFMDLVQRRFM